MSKQQEREWEQGESHITWMVGPFEVWLSGDNDISAAIGISIKGCSKTLCHETIDVPITVEQAKRRSAELILGWLDETREKVEYFRFTVTP